MNLCSLKSVVQGNNFMVRSYVNCFPPLTLQLCAHFVSQVENILRRIEGREPLLKALPKSRLKRVLIPVPAKAKKKKEGDAEENSSAASKAGEKCMMSTEKKLNDREEGGVEGDGKHPDEVEIDGITYLVRYEFMKDGDEVPAYPESAAQVMQHSFSEEQYMIRLADFKRLLTEAEVHPSDVTILLELFCLRDKRGYDIADIRFFLYYIPRQSFLTGRAYSVFTTLLTQGDTYLLRPAVVHISSRMPCFFIFPLRQEQ